jgi:hypothetical protein
VFRLHSLPLYTYQPLVIPCISPDFPHKLVALKKPADLTSLEILNILAFWSTTTTAGTPSLYSQLFLTHNLLGIDIVFAADANSSYLSASSAPKIVDHVPALLAAFQIKIKDFNDLMGTNFIDGGMSADLTFENVSMIYRYMLLARVLGIKPFLLPAIFTALELNAFSSVEMALKLIQLWHKFRTPGPRFSNSTTSRLEPKRIHCASLSRRRELSSKRQ